ncbi:MAG: GGDEF domain-containing protein [Gammaproteobacteria bacterium]|nr:GGDEF domain-containing protein [Gammaproteobacteria bacterium]
MKEKLPKFTATLIFGLGIFFFLVWLGSVYFLVTQLGQSISFWAIFWQYGLSVLLLVLVSATAVYAMLHRDLLRPIQQLAEKMAHLVNSQYSGQLNQPVEVTTGLEQMLHYFIELKKMAKRDSPTGLNNRAAFEERLDHAVRDSKRSGRKYALLLVEVDGIESISKQHGQYMVDALLKQVAERLNEGLRASDNVSQFEKNLFALLLEVQDQDQLVGLVEKIYLRTARRYRVLGRRMNISIMVGVSLYPLQAIEAKQLFEYAGSALREAQNTNCPIVFYESGTKTDISGFTLVQHLRQALDNDEFKLVFQPVIELHGHNTAYFEALLRWKDPQMHDVSIERTIQIAEKNQLIQPLTNWIVMTVCKLLKKQELNDLVIGVNLSMIDLHDRYLPRRIDKCLRKYGVNPGKLMIEITEGQIMQEPDEVADILSHLGMMGLSLSIDDFGTGQASLTYLKKLPVEKLKIDQSFIMDMPKNDDDRLIVKATIDLAHTLDLQVIAEGVENVEIYDMLTEMNCDYAQGYYISRPLEADQITNWYQQLGRH